jgi:hypothetical protein
MALTASLRAPGRPIVDRALCGFVVAVASVAFASAAVPALWTASFGVNRFQDDAFYYVVTARHFLQSGVFAFDGVTATNGFQPLWMAMVVAVLKLCGAQASLETQILAIVAMEKVCLAVAVACSVAFFVAARRSAGPWATGFLAVLVVLLCPTYVVFEQGMETTLAAAVFVVVLQCVAVGRPLALGLLLALLFVCRLDSGVFIGIPMLVWLCLQPQWSSRVKAWSAAPLLLVMASMVAWNYYSTGLTVPISGAIKSSFPRVTWHGGYLVEPFIVYGLYGWRTLLLTLNIAVCGALAVAGFGLLPLGKFPSGARAKCALVGVVAALLLANLLLFQKWEKSIDPRYLALPMIAAAFFLGATLEATLARQKLLAPILAAALLSFECGVWISRIGDTMQRTEDPARALFLTLRAALPGNAVLAGTDVGALAFWTQRRVVNLDGVISDLAYQAVVRDRKLAEYLRAQHVTHVATALWDREQSYTGRPPEPMYRHQVDAKAQRGEPYACHEYYVYSYVYYAYSDTLCLSAGDEVFRRQLGLDGVAQTSYVVYRLP